MRKYVKSALLVWDDECHDMIERIENNELGTHIKLARIEELVASPKHYLLEQPHLVFATNPQRLSLLLDLAYSFDCPVGFMPPLNAKKLQKWLELSSDFDVNLGIALGNEPIPISLISINDQIIFGDVIVGSIPLLSSEYPLQARSPMKRIILGFRQFFKMKLQRVVIETQTGKRITTAMGGLLLINRRQGELLSKLGDNGFSQRGNQLNLILVSPFSVFEFVKTALVIMLPGSKKSLPDAIGIIKSCSIKIKPSLSQIGRQEYGDNPRAPFECMIKENALRINAPEAFWESNPKLISDKETVKIENLPDEKETLKYHNKHIPFFPCASEERFKTLFLELRKDARIDSFYVSLMLMSTLLATIGLFANSSAVVIGAMLLAPLMAPIVSFAMGLLRADENLFATSLNKIAIGVILAMGASALVTYLLPDTTLTEQIHARINPTLLDLFVAIISGFAAAYSKSFKEIIQNLAGVAIAVALVPPLATAGIGIGRGDWLVFGGAFLLFFTNFVGISLSATMTFFILGYSSVFKSKRSFIVIAIIMIAISFPLHRSYNEMMQAHTVAQALAKERYLVNGKYIIIRETAVFNHGHVMRLDIQLVSRSALERKDLNKLKEKLQRRFGKKLIVHARVEYFL